MLFKNKKHVVFKVNKFFVIALGIPNNFIKQLTLKNPLFFSGPCETYLDTSPLPKLLSLHWNQINRVKNEADEQLLILLSCVQVSN